jgi:hypothetical protein
MDLPFMLTVITGSPPDPEAGAAALAAMAGVAAWDAASGMADKAAAAATGATTATQRRLVRALYLVNTWVIPFAARGHAGTGVLVPGPCATGPWRSGPRRGPMARSGTRSPFRPLPRPRDGP